MGEANITRITKKTRTSYTMAREYLEELARAGLVEEIKIGRQRIYRIVWSDTRIRILRTLIESGG